jgi:hypothetical protein
MNSFIEKSLKLLGYIRPYSRISPEQSVESNRHDCPHFVNRKASTCSDGMASYQVELKLVKLVTFDPYITQSPESSVQSVNCLSRF